MSEEKQTEKEEITMVSVLMPRWLAEESLILGIKTRQSRSKMIVKALSKELELIKQERVAA